MADFPEQRMPPPPILTTYHPESMGLGSAAHDDWLGNATSLAWLTANTAYFYSFRLTGWAVAYQLLFWVGATSLGFIDVGIFDTQKNAIVRAGSTAMSLTVNTVQELNIADTALPPGDYLLGGACDNTTGTCMRAASTTADEAVLPNHPVYAQGGLTLAALTDPAVPVVTTATTAVVFVLGVQLRPVF